MVKIKHHRILFLRKNYITEAECRRAFLNLGHSVESLTVTDYEPRQFLDLLVSRKSEYDFIFTLNGYGFDDKGVVSETLCNENVRVVSWELDQPYFFDVFHIKVKHPGSYFVQFVWDEGYLDDLHNRGFKQAFYLPNGCAPHFMETILQNPAPKDLSPEALHDKVSFVGTNLLHFIQTFLKENLDFDLFPTINHQLILDWVVEELLKDTELIFPDVYQSVSEKLILATMAEQEKYLLIAELLVSSEYRTRFINNFPEIQVYGSEEWKNIIEDSQYRRHIDYYGETPHVYRNSAININLTVTKNRFDSNQRIFDVPLCGGFLLTDRKRNLGRHFVEGEEIISFGSLEELRELIHFYLIHPENKKAIVQKARERVLKEHTYTHRIKTLLDKLENL